MENNQELLDNVVAEIQDCIKYKDLDALYVLLASTPREDLIAFLPEEEHHKFK